MPYCEKGVLAPADVVKNIATNKHVFVENLRIKNILLCPAIWVHYNRNRIVIKDKKLPAKKNGANGINCCFFCLAHIVPNMHAKISAIAKPVVPNHNPPTLISFISPIPMGLY